LTDKSRIGLAFQPWFDLLRERTIGKNYCQEGQYREEFHGTLNPTVLLPPTR
jgi:hypothetical protein